MAKNKKRKRITHKNQYWRQEKYWMIVMEQVSKIKDINNFSYENKTKQKKKKMNRKL